MKDVMLIIHFVGLIMGLGTSFAYMFLGIASSKMEEKEAETFTINTFALSKMGLIGLILLIVSGGYLMTSYWEILSSLPLLLLKLVLVVVLAALVGILSFNTTKAKKDGDLTQFKKVQPLGKIALVTSLIIVILAVYIFH